MKAAKLNFRLYFVDPDTVPDFWKPLWYAMCFVDIPGVGRRAVIRFRAKKGHRPRITVARLQLLPAGRLYETLDPEK